MSDEWYFKVMGRVYGPVTGQQLKQQATTGMVQRHTLVRKDDSGKWTQAWQVNGLLNVAIPPILPTTNQETINTQLTNNQNISKDTTAIKHKGMRFRYYWNAWQLSAFACWLIGGLMVLIPLLIVGRAMMSPFSYMYGETGITLAVIIISGVVFLAIGGTLHKIGTGKYR